MAITDESVAEGKNYIMNRIKEKATQKNINIEKLEWKTISKEKFELEIRLSNRIADKIFKKEELLYCQTKNQYKMNVEAKIISIILQLTK